jgi:hypothetical protein
MKWRSGASAGLKAGLVSLAASAGLALGGLAHAQDAGQNTGMSMPMAPSSTRPNPAPPKPAAPLPSQSAMPGTTGDKMDMPGMTMGDQHMAMMPAALGSGSMMREASGTSWQPDATPMDGIMGRLGGWSTMVHGYISGIYDNQGGPRGGDKTFSESMLMVMAEHQVGPGRLTLRSMLSLEPLMGASGYPLLLQTGETANGVTPLIDRQHPHNLFMELAGVYSVPLGDKASAFVYAGYPGEPALGPPAFMHRVSGVDDPAAPITHHWLDSTHITFGVITTGFVYGPWKIEGSVFNGREPDQNRWGFDPLQLNSFSGRVSLNPTPNWSFQISDGYLKSPEQLEPGVDQHRATASAIYDLPFAGGNWQTTLAWGRNSLSPGPTLDAFLLESAVSWKRHTVFARAESAQKNELFQPPSPLAGRVFRVAAASLGYIYDIPIAKHLALGLGVMGSRYDLPEAVKPAYGGSPTSYMTFVRFKTR